jgi:putative flippase GtrA
MPRWITLLRSAGVGVLATGTDLALLAVLVSALHVPVRLASVAALTSGIFVQFIGNKLLAFGDRSNRWLAQGAQFLGAETLGFLLNVALYDLAITHTELPYFPVRLATTSIVYFLVCFPLWLRIFRQPLATGETTN